jgi:hypothetical protein
MINKAKQIRGYKQANPTHKPSDIAKACGATLTYVYQVLHKMQKKTVKPVAAQPTAGQETVRKEIIRLNNEIEKWKNAAEFQERRANECLKHNRELKLHHNGLEYVISYLESRLGIKEQDGTTV